MDHILTVEQLGEILDEIEAHEHAKIMRRIKISPASLSSYASWSENDYTRNCLLRTNKYEILLLCWDPGSVTPIHDHGGEDCWVYQVQGSLVEKRFKEVSGQIKETNRMQLKPGNLTYMHDRMGYHTIENNSDHRAMSLHIYASPIDSCNVYNENKDCFETKNMSYDSYKKRALETSVS
jgi:cysteine dioxygenase